MSKFNNLCNTILKEANKQLPHLGTIVTKVDAPEDDRKEYVVVGVEYAEEGNWIWIYPLGGNMDYENTRAERTFSENLV